MNSKYTTPNYLLTGVFLLLSILTTGQNINEVLNQNYKKLQASEGMVNAAVSLAIADTRTGELLFKTTPQLSLVTASIMKAVTTATALEILDPKYKFNTIISHSGIIKNDTLFGDLQIIGGGDPTLGSSYFKNSDNFIETSTHAISKKGIKYIKGDILTDETIYDNVTIPGSWVWDDIGNYYGAGATGISAFDNLYEIIFSSDIAAGVPVKITCITPEIPELEIINNVISSDINADRAFVYGSPFDSKRIIRGTIPKNRNEFKIKASIPNPANVLANELIIKLKDSGIQFSGKILNGIANKSEATEIFVNQSPSLSEIIKITNYESVNLFAEHLIKQIAVQKFGIGSTKEGCLILTQFWKEKGIDINGFFVADGSGLSRFNSITAEQLTGILNYMATKSSFSAEFFNSLPPAGEGTLNVFSKNNFANESLRAKSGSMTRVRSYTGYLRTDSGKQLSFTIILNNFSCSQNQAIKYIENFLIELQRITY